MIRSPLRSIRPLVAFALLASPAAAINLVFQEDFESIPLGTSPTYGDTNAWSDDPPPGWQSFDNLPGIGVPEWAGWAFAREQFWKNVGGNDREDFLRADGKIAIADPDLWNDQGDPANTAGFYNTLLRTPPIAIDTIDFPDDTLRLGFDSSWRGGCCDDGALFDPGGNNQTAFINVRIDGGAPIEVLRWESAPFYEDVMGELRPTTNPFNSMGDANIPNEFYRPDVLNERYYLDLSQFLPPGLSGSGELAMLMAESAGGGGGMIEIEFGMTGAGDDGWWAIDNIEMVSMSTILGDMNIDTVLDAADIDAFALGMRNPDAYADLYAGSHPVDRGSPDDTFNFDDIPWFVALMEGAGVSSPAMALAHAMTVPEPSTAPLLLAAALSTLCAGRRT